MNPDLQAFLERYRDAFNVLDGDAVAALYAEPSAISQGGQVTHWADQAAVASNMRALCELYRGRAFVSANFELLHAMPLGDHDAVLDLRWCITWAGSEPAWHFSTAYHLTRTPEGWRVLLCTAHDEHRLWQAATSPPAARNAMPVRIEPLNDAADANWLRLRLTLWPDASAAEHRAEMHSLTAQPQRYMQFMARNEAGTALGLAEAALRHDYVPGTDTSPVAFLEGLFVEPSARGQGVARALVAAVEHWARARGCSELASDTHLHNTSSQQVHRRLGFALTERIVCFCKVLKPAA